MVLGFSDVFEDRVDLVPIAFPLQLPLALPLLVLLGLVLLVLLALVPFDLQLLGALVQLLEVLGREGLVGQGLGQLGYAVQVYFSPPLLRMPLLALYYTLDKGRIPELGG